MSYTTQQLSEAIRSRNEQSRKAQEASNPSVPSHLAAIINKRATAASDGLQQPIKQAFLGKSALTSDPERSLVSASWDANARLQLQFDDGQKIVTDPVPISEYIEQHVAISTNPIFPYIQFDTTAAVPSAVGQLAWNSAEGTLDLGLEGGNVTLQVGQEEVLHIYNNTAVDFAEMQVLIITGSQGQRLTGGLAKADSELTSSATFAVVTEPILKNTRGFATTSGLVRNIDTSAFPEGAALYLSPTVAGGVTHIKPVAPNHMVLIGWCVRSQSQTGSIYVHIQNGYELNELHNVLITTVQDRDLLQYDAVGNVWKNTTMGLVLDALPAADVSLPSEFAVKQNGVWTRATLAQMRTWINI